MSATYWHEKTGAELAHEVEDLCKQLEEQQKHRRERYIRNLELFEGTPLGAYGASAYYRMSNKALANDPLGLIHSAVETAVAEVYAKQKPKPQVQTSGADWTTRRRAKKMDKVFEGILHQRQGRWVDMWHFMVEHVGYEVALQGVAFIKVVSDLDERRIVHELVPACEIYADPCEGAEPLNLFQASPIDVAKAVALFCNEKGDRKGNARRKAAIEGAEPFTRDELQFGSRVGKAVTMRTAWRLPLGPSLPGKVAVVIGGELMAEDDWESPIFPFVAVHWRPHRDGIYGCGIADIGGTLAEDAGDLDRRLFSRAKIASGKRVYYQEGSVAAEALEANGPEVAVPVQAGAPIPTETLVPPFTAGEFEYRVSKIRDFWDALGISQVSAAARREPGIESAVAQRTLNDTKTGRQLVKAQAFERAFPDLAHQWVWRLRELQKADPNFSITWPGKRLIMEVKWSDADITSDTFTITVGASSALPNDPWGRLEMAGELYAQKLISDSTYRQLLGWPDIEQELDAESAEYEYLDALIDRYLDADENTWDMGDYESPEGFMIDKPRALVRVSSAYFRAKLDNAPPFNLELLRRYIRELDALMMAAAQAQAALMQGQGAPPSQGGETPSGMTPPGPPMAPGGAPPDPPGAPPMAA